MTGVITDVTDATFDAVVVQRSHSAAVVVDLWAPWCGPCRTLGPLLEKAVAATGGKVELAKVNVDENPAVASAFRVQSIPAVFAVVEGRVADSFIGALPEREVQSWVARVALMAPQGAGDAGDAGSADVDEVSDVERWLVAGDEAALREALEADPGNEPAVVALATLLVERGAGEEALALLERVPETAEVRRVAALARVGVEVAADDGAGIVAELDSLLDRVKGDDEARQRFLDLLEVLGPDDPRTAQYRRALTARLF